MAKRIPITIRAALITSVAMILVAIITALLTGYFDNDSVKIDDSINVNGDSNVINNTTVHGDYIEKQTFVSTIENDLIQDLYLRTHIEIDGISKPVLVDISFFNSGDYDHEITSVFLEIQNIKENGQKRWIEPDFNMPLIIKSKESKIELIRFSLNQDDISKIFYLNYYGKFIYGPINYNLLIEFFDKRGNKRKKTFELARLDIISYDDAFVTYVSKDPDSSYVLIRD